MNNFKGTKEPWYAIDYAGVIILKDSDFYEGKNILDAEDVGKEVVEANAKLAICAPKMYNLLQNIFNSQQVEGNYELWSEIKQLLKEANP